MNLFKKQNVKLNSGQQSDFKIDCDAFTDEDWECIAYLISKGIRFKKVVGVPTGGLKLQKALEQYCIDDENNFPILICDDVLTTGGSMQRMREELDHMKTHIIGVVVFSRLHVKKVPNWIHPVLILNERMLPPQLY